MKGQVKFRIYDKDNEYRFTLKRNITIIQGESGTGKTTLLQAMFNSMSGSSAAAYTVETSANYFVYTRAFKKLRWETVLAEITDSVILLKKIIDLFILMILLNMLKNLVIILLS